MPTLHIEVAIPPLTALPDGTLRIGNTRIALDTVIGYYNQGYGAEQIAEGFDTLRLADIHAVIAYYLNHRAEVDDYLAEREREAQELRARSESTPAAQAFRERLRERKAAWLAAQPKQEPAG